MRGRRGERVRRPAESGARGRAGRGAAQGHAARGVRAGRCSGAEKGERRREEGKKKKKWRKEKKMGKREKEKEKGRGKRERGRCVRADCGDRSRVADLCSSGAGWDSGEVKKERSTVSGKRVER